MQITQGASTIDPSVSAATLIFSSDSERISLINVLNDVISKAGQRTLTLSQANNYFTLSEVSGDVSNEPTV